MATKQKSTINTGSEDFKALVVLLKKYTTVVGALNKLQAEMDNVHLDWLRQIVDQAIEAQESKERIESEAELLCRRHVDDWFSERRSVKTPIGSACFHRSTELSVASDELALQLLHGMDGKPFGEGDSIFDMSNYVRVETTLNVEALATLDDATLSRLKIKRVAKDNFALKPATVDLGKAVEEKKAEKKQTS